MKTKLFLFIGLLLSVFSFAQVRIFEGFESGIPSTWANSGASIQSSGGQTGRNYIQMTMSLGSNTTLATSNYTSDGSAITLSIKYNKFAGAFGEVGLRYYANSSATPINISSVGLFSSQSSGYQTLTGNIAAGNIPSGMTVRFELYVWGQGGSSTAIFFDNFTAYQESGLLKPIITVNPITTGATTASISYGLLANSLSATSVIKYGTSSTNLSSSATGFSAIGTNVVSSDVNLTGLLQNTLYYYQIEATNSKGTEQSIIGSFTTAPPVPQLITEYNFNGTYNNVNGNAPFASNTGTSFVTGRDGVTVNGAININNTGTTATILGLPYNNTPRTISLWAKANSFLSGGYNWIFSYGQESGGSAQAGSFTQSDVSYLGYFTNLFTNTNVTHAVSTWYHFVYVYDGTIAKIYRNGVLIRSAAISWNTLNNNNNFNLGVAFGNTAGINGAIDDLKIYNYAISDSQAADLYLNNSLTPQVIVAPILSNISFIPGANSEVINFSAIANNAATTFVVRYGVSETSLTSQVGATAISGNDVFTTTAFSRSSTLTGLQLSTKYYFVIEATNFAGTTTSAVLNFTTPSFNPPIAEYTFDNTLNNVNGANPFALQTGMVYGTNKLGVANKALYIDGTGTTVSLTTLPVGFSARTISIWINPSQVNADNKVFSYGSSVGTTGYGASFNSSRLYNFTNTENLYYDTATSVGVWKHLVFTYQPTSATAKIYIDGELKASGYYNTWNTTNNGVLYLGSLFGNAGSKYFGYVDDLKIYNYVLSDTEVAYLFNENSILSSQNFNQNNLQVSLYPNPVKDILHIETAGEIKSVTVYGILGNQVLTSTSKDVNVSHLSKGTYIVKIQDTNNAVSTKKIIKE